MLRAADIVSSAPWLFSLSTAKLPKDFAYHCELQDIVDFLLRKAHVNIKKLEEYIFTLKHSLAA